MARHLGWNTCAVAQWTVHMLKACAWTHHHTWSEPRIIIDVLILIKYSCAIYLRAVVALKSAFDFEWKICSLSQTDSTVCTTQNLVCFSVFFPYALNWVFALVAINSDSAFDLIPINVCTLCFKCWCRDPVSSSLTVIYC